MSHAGREVRGPRARNPGGGVLSDDGQHNNLFLTGRGEGSKKNKDGRRVGRASESGKTNYI